MKKIFKLLHDIDVKSKKSSTNKSKDKFKYVGSLFFGLIEIIKIERSMDSNHAKRLMLESFCFNAKRILDQYKTEFNNSIYFHELKKIRNILAHDIITYEVNGNGIVFNNYEKGMEARYSQYYSSNDGSINISRFMLYYTHLLVREFSKIIYEDEFTGLEISSIDLVDGVKILSEYDMDLDDIHDQYVEVTSPVYSQPKASIKPAYCNEEYIEKCKDALSWITGKEFIFPVDCMHINISLFIFSKEIKDTLFYSNQSERIIKEIEISYPFTSIYLLHIYTNLSKDYYDEKDKRNSLSYGLKSIALSRKLPVRLLDRISNYVNLANAYSLYNSPRECRVLLICFNLLDEAVKDNYKNIHEYQFMVLKNLLDSYLLHNKVLPDCCIDSFSDLYDSKIDKSSKIYFKKKVISYYVNVQNFQEAASLVRELIDKKNVLGSERLSFQLTEIYLMHMQGMSVLKEFLEVERKIEKLTLSDDESYSLNKQYQYLKELIKETDSSKSRDLS